MKTFSAGGFLRPLFVAGRRPSCHGCLLAPKNQRSSHAVGPRPRNRAISACFFLKTDVPVQLRNRCESAMRGLGCGAHIERSVASSRLTRFAPCFLTFVRRVHSQTFEGGIDAPRFLVSEWFIGIRIDRVMSARDAGARYKLV